jgi:hypothetical protein
MMKPILFRAALAALLAASASISAEETSYAPAYDIAYYSHSGTYHFSDQVGQSRGGCGPDGPVSHMEWGYETIFQDSVIVAYCPVSL